MKAVFRPRDLIIPAFVLIVYVVNGFYQNKLNYESLVTPLLMIVVYFFLIVLFRFFKTK